MLQMVFLVKLNTILRFRGLVGDGDSHTEKEEEEAGSGIGVDIRRPRFKSCFFVCDFI